MTYDIYTSIPQNNEVGGKQNLCNILPKLSQSIEPSFTPHPGEDSVDLEYELKKRYELTKPRLINPADYNDLESLLNAVGHWWEFTMRKRNTTYHQRRNLLMEMATSDVFPIDLFDLNPNQVYYQLTYLEENYNKVSNRDGKDAIRNRWKAITMYAKSIGMDTSSWNYVPPARGKPKHKVVPLPETVHRLIHAEYSEDPYENALFQYLMMHGFAIGWRCPSEPAFMKVGDIHIDEGYVHFYQPKVETYRMSVLEPELMMMTTRKSFKNWIDKWRPKVTNQHSGDFLYLEPSGKPFTKHYLNKRMNLFGKSIWSEFHPYCQRDFCFIARLIQNGFNIQKVTDWFEHGDIRTTQYYVRDAEKYHTMRPSDWIKAVLKSPSSWGEENSLKSKEGLKTPVSNGNPPRERNGPMGIRTPVSGSEGRKDIQATS
jgi:site-specific recombinase XerD